MDGGVTGYVVLVILLLLSAFFSASETAFSALNTIRLKNYVKEGNKKAKTALDIAENFDSALSTILIGNNIVNISSASLATILATQIWPNYGAAISTVAMTVLVLILGEVLPKTYAKENSEAVALAVAKTLKALIWLFTPLVWVFKQLKKLIPRKKEQQEAPSVTEQELKYIIETIEGEGVLDEQESELVQSALDFNDITAQEILTPRVDMVAVDVADSPEEILETVLTQRFSRIPVYERSTDNIIGVLQSRDYLEARIRGEEKDIHEMLTECVYVHKTMRISALLNEFKKNKLHMAVVTDDYGGTMGIVTTEDILEELVGEIWDEDDEIKDDCVELAPGVFEVSGDLNLEEMFERMDYQPPKDFDSDYNTAGGWALEVLEHIPEEGESFQSDGLTVTVTELDDQRIVKLRVELPVEEKPEQEK